MIALTMSIPVLALGAAAIVALRRGTDAEPALGALTTTRWGARS